MNIINIESETRPISIGNFNIISGNVIFGKNVIIGDNCSISTKHTKQNIFIGDNTKIKNNVIIEGNVTLGDNNTIYHGCIIGSDPQHKGVYNFNKQKIVIGSNNIFRENTIIDMPFDNETKIGNNNYIMNGVTIAHDVFVENNVVISVGCCVGGYAILQEYCNIGMNSEIHQFCRIGKYSMVGMGTSINKDLLPFHIYYKDKLSINFMGISKNLNFNNYSFSSKNFSENLLLLKNKKELNNKELKNIFDEFIKNTKLGYYDWEGE